MLFDKLTAGLTPMGTIVRMLQQKKRENECLVLSFDRKRFSTASHIFFATVMERRLISRWEALCMKCLGKCSRCTSCSRRISTEIKWVEQFQPSPPPQRVHFSIKSRSLIVFKSIAVCLHHLPSLNHPEKKSLNLFLLWLLFVAAIITRPERKPRVKREENKN